MKKSKLAKPYILWAILFIVIPLFLVLFLAFTKIENGSYVPSLDNAFKFVEPIYISIMLKSFNLSFWTTVISILLAYPAAYILARSDIKKKNIYLMLMILPMWMNMLLRTYSWLTILENKGIINTILSYLNIAPLKLMYNDGAILLGMVYNFLPFMILSLYSVLSKIDTSLEEASMDLGASPFTTFRKITFPLSLGGLYSGSIMVFVPALSSFIIPRLLSGGKISLFGNLIERHFLKIGDWHFGSFLALILMLLILLSLFFLDIDAVEKGDVVWKRN